MAIDQFENNLMNSRQYWRADMPNRYATILVSRRWSITSWITLSRLHLPR
ncbi:hypothetical protein OKT76_17095 [Providencia rettgeri]|nr:hypothetical protein [Providencia rettgeri]MCX9097445.1 hypothetical protein [Providencia rettgeri]